MVPAIGRTTPPRLRRLRDKAFVTPETDDSVPAEACLSREDTPLKVALTVEVGPCEAGEKKGTRCNSWTMANRRSLEL